MAKRDGLVLRWQRALISHLADNRPAGHTSILAVAMVMVSHADPDGSSVYPRQDTIGREAGLHHSTVKEAVEYLVASGFVVHVRNRARGLREYRLQIAGEPNSEPQNAGEPNSDEVQIAGQIADDSRPDRGSLATTSSLPPRPSARSSNGHTDTTDVEIRALARSRAVNLGARNPDRLAAKIAREDRADLEDEIRRRHRDAHLTATRDACPSCDDRGFLLDSDRVPVEPVQRCDHSAAVQAPDPDITSVIGLATADES